jgi:membrane fusion protein
MSSHQKLPETSDDEPNSTFFRKEALRRRHDTLEGVALVESGLSWPASTLLVVLVLFTVGVVIGIATYPVSGVATGFLRPQTAVARVVVDRPGSVGQLFVGEGKRVERYSPLLSVILRDLGPSSGSISSINAASIDAEQASAEQQIQAERQAQVARRQSAMARVGGLQSEVTALVEREKILEASVGTAERQFQLSRDLAQRGYITRRELSERELAYLSRKEALAALAGDRQARISAVRAATADLNLAEFESVEKLRALEAKRAQLARAKAEILDRTEYTIVANMAGLVSNVTVRSGDYVKSGQTIMSIGESTPALTAELRIKEDLVPLIAPGQRVRLSLNSLPGSRYGFVPGTIRYVSRAPLVDESSGTDVQYRAVAHIDLDRLPRQIKSHLLVDGMTFKAYIELRRASLWSRLFSPQLWYSFL